MMRIARVFAIALAGLLLHAPAAAENTRRADPYAALDPGAWFDGAIREADVSLVLGYVRAALRAALEGREPPPPPAELGERAEALAGELKARGALGALAILAALEAHAKALVREGAPPPRSGLPAVSPSTRI